MNAMITTAALTPQEKGVVGDAFNLFNLLQEVDVENQKQNSKLTSTVNK